MSISAKNYSRPQGVRPKRILVIGPNTKESIFDSRWVTAHQGSHWWASRLNEHGHFAATYDMNLQPGEIADDPEHSRVSLEELFKKGMPGFIHKDYVNDGEWRPFTDLLKLFSIKKYEGLKYEPGHEYFLIDDPDIIWQPWDIIGFSILDATIEYDIAKIIKARELCPMALLVGGGSQATLNYQTIFDKSPLDMVILGQEPFAMLRIANEEKISLFEPKSVSGIVIRNNSYVMTSEIWKEWIDELDFQAMHQDLYWGKTACLYENPQFQDINTFRLFIHNFCPVNCAYCTLTGLQRAATGKPTKAVGLGGLDIVAVIKRVLEKYPDTHQIFFCDDDFMLTPAWGHGFCDAMIEAKATGEIPERIGFICLTNINRLDKTLVEKCAKAGFRVLSIGVESVSQWKLNSMNKPQTPEKIWEVTKLILDSGIKPYYTLLIHTPYERPEDMVVDINGFRKMAKMGVGLSIEPYLMPLHGTIFYEADVPTRYKVIPIEGSRETIKKGTAWIPARKDSLEIFLMFEKYFPRFKKWRYDSDKAVKHKEKNYYSHVILDCQEWILKHFFLKGLLELYNKGIGLDEHRLPEDPFELGKIQKILDDMGDYDVDSVGAVIKRKSVSAMEEVDFSIGRVDVRELQRKMAMESEQDQKISSVDSSETLREKGRKDTATAKSSFH